MGSNVSSIEEKKIASVASAQATAVPHAYKRSTGHRWPSAAPPKDGAATAAPDYKSKSKIFTGDDRSNEVEIIRPTIPAHSVNTNRVISFHSSANWREYFEDSKQSDKLVVVFFTASWCGYCRYMDPILDDFAAQYTEVEFDKIDVDELFNVSREFGVHAMPTFLLIKRGQVIDKVTGAKHEDLRRKIEKHTSRT